MSSESIAYFNRSVMEYNKGDVVELLSDKITCAGPLLSIIVNGIDLAGGICFGFDKGSRARSEDFMVEHMNIQKELASLLYTCVRCGVAHQGMPKVGVRFFLMPQRFMPGAILFRDSNIIYLNVTELAYSYLGVIENIAKNPTEYELHHPPLKPADKDTFTTALSFITNDISELCDKVAAKDRAEEEAKLARGEIDQMSSLSAYLPDNTLNISLEI